MLDEAKSQSMRYSAAIFSLFFIQNWNACTHKSEGEPTGGNQEPQVITYRMNRTQGMLKYVR